MSKAAIHIGADHRGYELKENVIERLQAQGYTVHDAGTYASEPACDYPVMSRAVATAVAADARSKGILVCMTGIGHSIAANKVPGVRAALCYNKEAAALSRQHNDANVLVLGSKFVSESELYDIVDTWLASEFEGGRHDRRVNQISEIEREFLK